MKYLAMKECEMRDFLKVGLAALILGISTRGDACEHYKIYPMATTVKDPASASSQMYSYQTSDTGSYYAEVAITASIRSELRQSVANGCTQTLYADGAGGISFNWGSVQDFDTFWYGHYEALGGFYAGRGTQTILLGREFKDFASHGSPTEVSISKTYVHEILLQPGIARSLRAGDRLSFQSTSSAETRLNEVSSTSTHVDAGYSYDYNSNPYLKINLP